MDVEIYSDFYGNAEAYAMERYIYVLCFKCGKAYFGGESRCQQVKLVFLLEFGTMVKHALGRTPQKY